MARKDLASFNARMRARADRIELAINNLVKKVALTVDQTVVLATPVDTGRARSNWIATLSLPSTGTREPYAPGEELGREERANAQGAMEQAKQVVATRQRGQSIHITNNLDYIEALNNGSSQQAPVNFVGKSIIGAVEAIKSTKVIRG